MELTSCLIKNVAQGLSLYFSYLLLSTFTLKYLKLKAPALMTSQYRQYGPITSGLFMTILAIRTTSDFGDERIVTPGFQKT